MSAARNAANDCERRFEAITAIGIEVKALIFDRDEIMATQDPRAERLLYARAFQSWADGRIAGEAQDIFLAVQEALDL